MSEHELEVALTDWRRTYENVAAALADATTRTALNGDRGEYALNFERSLVELNNFLDRAAIVDLMVALTCFLAAKMQSTPRTVHEQLFELAPTDEWWRERLER
jgi:membrane protein required for beta-lactamase induction